MFLEEGNVHNEIMFIDNFLLISTCILLVITKANGNNQLVDSTCTLLFEIKCSMILKWDM